MIKYGDLKVGAKVRCCHKIVPSSGYTATVSYIDNGVAGLIRDDNIKGGGRTVPFKDGLMGQAWTVYFNSVWQDSGNELFLLEAPTQTNKNESLLKVRGYEPKIVIKIGCIEVPYENAEQIAKRILTSLKVKKYLPFVTVGYSGHNIELSDVEEFLVWFKQYKKEANKRRKYENN